MAELLGGSSELGRRDSLSVLAVRETLEVSTEGPETEREVRSSLLLVLLRRWRAAVASLLLAWVSSGSVVSSCAGVTTHNRLDSESVGLEGVEAVEVESEIELELRRRARSSCLHRSHFLF